MSPRPTAASPKVWSVANRLLFGSTVSSRKLLYQPTGLPAANSATRLGWKGRKRGDTVGEGITPRRQRRGAPSLAMQRHATGRRGRGQRRLAQISLAAGPDVCYLDSPIQGACP